MSRQQGTNIYDALGGAAVVRRIAERCYALMDELPEASQVRRLHPARLDGCIDSLHAFLSDWLGGPPLARPRPPQTRERPSPAIAAAECHEWRLCMRLALTEVIDDAELRAGLIGACDPLAPTLLGSNCRDGAD